MHAFTGRLLEHGLTEKSNPRSTIERSLLMQVQREIGSGKKTPVLLEFKAFQKEKFTEDADTSINFDYSCRFFSSPSVVFHEFPYLPVQF